MSNETCGNCQHEVGEHRNSEWVRVFRDQPCFIENCDCPEFESAAEPKLTV